MSKSPDKHVGTASPAIKRRPRPKSRKLPPEALRALAEAEARRAAAAQTGPAADEVGGRGGLEPTRYGDWEVKGIVSDF